MFNPFYFSLIRKYTSLFGNLFRNIRIERTDADGTVIKVIEVPIEFVNKEKPLERLFNDPDLNKKEAIYLPRMAFEMTQVVHDPERQINPTHEITLANHDTKNAKSQYIPAPYDFKFSLYVYAKNLEDGNKIVEQIFPYFTPEFTIAADLIPELNVVQKNIPIILDSNSFEDRREGEFENRRAIIWTLDFTLKGWFYGPVREAKIIKFANVTFYDSTRYADIKDSIGVVKGIDRVTVQPGLTANGEPTSNASLSIPYLDINADDDYGYIIDIYGTLDGD